MKGILEKVEIVGISHQGKGVGRFDGKVVFVEGAVPGEVVDVLLTKKAKKFNEGKAINVITASNARIEANCGLHSQCGGCVYRFISYDEEINLKTRIVKETLKKIAGVDDVLVSKCLPSPVNEHYRNKLQYHVEIIDGKPRLGFIDNNYNFFPSLECNIADKAIVAWAPIIEKHLPDHVTRVIIRRSFPSGKLMCLLLSNQEIKLSNSAIKEINSFPNAFSLFGNMTSSNAPDIPSLKTYKIFGEDYLTEEINNFKFAVGPTSFFQVNPYQTALLYERALQFLEDEENLLDLFCGVGSITLFAALKSQTAFGVELSNEAIKYAKINAQLNEVDNVKFLAGDVEQAVDHFTENYSAIILDPPRKGCPQKVLQHIASKTKKIIYVSCESSTLARDIKILKEIGFEVKKVIPVDMFPRTAHVECVVLLQR